jgi:hypothetical protein
MVLTTSTARLLNPHDELSRVTDAVDRARRISSGQFVHPARLARDSVREYGNAAAEHTGSPLQTQRPRWLLLVQRCVGFCKNAGRMFDTVLTDIDAWSADKATIRRVLATAEAAPNGSAC